MNKQRVVFCVFMVFGPIVAGIGLSDDSPIRSWRFDMGTEDSPVARGYVRVTPKSNYSSDRKFGWEDSRPDSFDIRKPDEDPMWLEPSGQVVPENYLIHKEHTDLTRDGVSSKQDLVFRVDVPNGKYDAVLTLGRLDKPTCSMQISINGQLQANDFDAKHWVNRKRPDQQYGFPRRMHRTVLVENGRVQIRVHGEDSGFRKRFDQEYDKPALASFLEGTYFDGIYRPGRPFSVEGFDGGVMPRRGDVSIWGKPPLHMGKVWVWEDIGGPFTENAISSIEIHPHKECPLVWENKRLNAKANELAVGQGVAAFQAEDWKTAEHEFDRVNNLYARALGYLWLAGRPQYEEERRLLPKAIAILEQVAESKENDWRVQNELDNARRLARTIHRFDHRGELQRSYTELILAAGEVNSMQPDDPLYYKSRIYAGRSMYMIIPHRWTFAAGVGRQYFEELERAGFADNRFVRWFLYDEWKPHDPDWVFPDYSTEKKGAPTWAGEVYEAYNREIDLGEWWIRNRQHPNGSLGGGWGDDVEILRTLGAFASVCPDASPDLIQGIRNVVEGVWNSGSIDREAGYFAEVDDAEHGGEWTGDTLTAMIRLDYGNPLYVERAMKTGKLMRDLWMDRTPSGLFLMRSNYLGATGVGWEGTHNDSRINFRCASPARSVLRYNKLAALQTMYVDWANTWLSASMSTDRGKPQGVIPEEIGYPSGMIGGNNSPTWFIADHPPNTENGDWGGTGGYQNYIIDLFMMARELTGDDKYLEPLRLQAEFVEKNLPTSIRDSIYFREGRLHPSLWENYEPGSSEWIAAKLSAWPKEWRALQEKLYPPPSTKESMLSQLKSATKNAQDEIDGARRRIPHTTSEAMATDRVHFPGMNNAVRIMTGSAEHGEGSLVSYRGLGRKFAAVLLRADAAQVRIVIYNFDKQTKEASFIPWALRQGDEFEFTVGPDNDGDTIADEITDRKSIHLESQAQEIPFRVKGRSQMVLDLTRVATGPKPGLLPDLAVTTNDIAFRSEFNKIDVSVHNIGAASAGDATVLLFDDAKREIGRQSIPHLSAPILMDPQIVRIAFPMDLSKMLGRSFTVRIDAGDGVKEITKLNNQATATCPLKLPPRKVHSHP